MDKIVFFRYANTSECRDLSNNVTSECICDYLEISEHPYETVSNKKYCGYSATHRTQTRSANVKLIIGQTNERAVLSYRAHS